jgi:uncharacterized protein involved in cysteine biosynthesis
VLRSFRLAAAQLADPAVRRVVWRSAGLSLAVLVALAAGLWWALAALPRFESEWLNWLVDIVSALGFLLGAALLFPAVVSAFVGLFLDDVAGAVERRHYPADPPGKPLAFGPNLVAELRFALVVIGCNLLALPVYVAGFFLPPLNLVVYYLLNGYLLGREYFQLIAWRHLDQPAAAALRRRHQGRLLAAGCLIAFLLTVPVVNLIAPVLATAAMVHIVRALRAG